MFSKQSYPLPYQRAWSVLDSSKLKDYLRCPRYYFFRHILGWESARPNNHLVFGSAIHEAMDQLLTEGYGNPSLVKAIDRFMTYYRAHFPESTDEIFHPKTPAQAVKMLMQYAQEYASDQDRYETLMTEIGGTVPIRDGVVLYFRMDSVLRDVTVGKILSREHKTTAGSFTRVWCDDFILSLQVGTYTHALYCLYEIPEVLGVEINGMCWSKAKTPTISFKRLPMYRTIPQMQQWLWTVNHWIDAVATEMDALAHSSADNQVLQAFPQDPTGCTDYFGCQYMDYCSSWPNPLRKLEFIPAGLQVNFWDPMENDRPVKKEVHLEGR